LGHHVVLEARLGEIGVVRSDWKERSHTLATVEVLSSLVHDALVAVLEVTGLAGPPGQMDRRLFATIGERRRRRAGSADKLLW
jgi:hypothetical protein